MNWLTAMMLTTTMIMMMGTIMLNTARLIIWRILPVVGGTQPFTFLNGSRTDNF